LSEDNSGKCKELHVIGVNHYGKNIQNRIGSEKIEHYNHNSR
jgi:hypothetical protein